MNLKGFVLAAALATAVLAAGCVEFEGEAKGRRSAEGSCSATQGPHGQAASCDFGPDGYCWGSQGPSGQSGGCRFGA